MRDVTYVLMAMHPVSGMTLAQVTKGMREIGFPGTTTHARVAISRCRPYLVRGSQGWQLTEQGQTYQRMVLRDIRTIITKHLSNAKWA